MSVVYGESNGISTCWAETPEPFVALLMFRVGRADETVPTLGTTHLVEHLALFPLGRTDFPVNGSVDDTKTVFYAQGTEPEIRQFLESVAASLSDLPIDRLEAERRVLMTEAANEAPLGLIATLQSLRCGAQGHGLVNYREFGLQSVTGDDVRDWAAAQFTAGNAALGLAGPHRPEIDLVLPAGARRAPPGPVTLPEVPAYLESEGGPVALSCIGTRSTPLWVATAVAHERMNERLRRERGMTYSAGSTYDPWTAGQVHLTFGADCLPDHAATVSAVMLETLNDLAHEGPLEDEIDRVAELFRRATTEPYAGRSHVHNAIVNELFGAERVSTEEVLEECRNTDPQAAADALAEALASAIMMSPDIQAVTAHGFTRFGAESDPRPVDGKTFSSGLVSGRLGRNRKSVIHGGEAGVSARREDDRWVTVPFRDCVAVVEEPGDVWTLLSKQGDTIRVAFAEYASADELRALIRARVPDDLFVPLDRAALTNESQVALAAESMLGKKRPGLSEKALTWLASELAAGENVACLALYKPEGFKGNDSVLAITDRRLLAVTARAVKDPVATSVRFSEIATVETKTGFLANDLEVDLRSGESRKYEMIAPKEQLPEIAQLIRSELADPTERALADRARAAAERRAREMGTPTTPPGSPEERTRSAPGD